MDGALVQELWDENPDAILAVAPDDAVLYWNRAALEIFGYTSAEACGRKLADPAEIDLAEPEAVI
jgi:PAS domain S-box-containing protein